MRRPAHSFLVEIIGRYQVKGEVGAGGFATVYRAHDPVLDRELAIKLLHTHLARDPQLRVRFVREGRALARIRHPNVVQVHDAGETDGTAYLAMEFVEGSSLAAIAAQRPLAPGEIAGIVRQVASALDALHAAGLVHRDIKPANILVQPDGRAVLLDLGVAHASDATTATTSGLIVGTPGFLAPEQVEPRVPVSPATDVYQLAATVYTLLAGRPPFEGDTVQVLYAVIHREPPDLGQIRPDLPPHVVAALGAGMAKDPAWRPRRATDFAALLEGSGPGPAPHPAPSSGQWQGAQSAGWQTPPPGPRTPPATPHPWTGAPTPAPAQTRSPLPEWWPAALAGVAAVVLLLAAALVITAGGDGDDGDTPPSPGQPATTAVAGRAGAAIAITLSPTATASPAAVAAATTTAAGTASAPSPTPTATAMTCQWAGTWRTSFGTLTLQQSGASVTGSYRYTRDGTLEGTVEGNVLRGQWVEKPLPNERQTQPNQFNGDFEFTIDTGCRSFAGRWRYGSEGAWDTWLGVRQ